MKTISPLAATIAVVLAASSLNAQAAELEVRHQTVSGTPAFVAGNIDMEGSDAVGVLKNLVAEQSQYAANGNEDFKVVDHWTDELGKTHTRVHQTINGLKVYGSSMIVHSQSQQDANGFINDSVYAVSGSLAVNPEHLPRTVLLGSKSPVAKQFKKLGAELGKVLDEPELAYVYLPLSGETKLAWKMEVSYDRILRDIVFFDAYDKSLLTRHAQVHSAKSWKTYTLNGGSAQSAPGTLLCTNSQNCGGNAAAQRAHDGASKVYDYYLEKFNRRSINNADMTMISSVDMGEANAYWTGQQMIYGKALNGLNDFTSDFDIIGHELTHGVTQHTAGLVYQNAPGALNEAWSDILGVSAESYKNGTTTSSWLLGDGLYNTGGKAFRYMNNPTQDNYSKDWWPERIPFSSSPNNQNDYGGVHGNSGIANLAYTLLVDGGTHPRGKSSKVVPAIGMAKAEQIFYRALSTYMNSNTDFKGAKTATAQAAQDLYGATEKAAVVAAWCAVGVDLNNCDDITIPPPGALTKGVPVSVPSVSTGQSASYTFDVPAGSQNVTISISGGSGDADLYTKFGAEPTDSVYDCRPYLDGNNESCTGAHSGGKYYVRIKAYSAFSGVTVVGNYDGDIINPPDCDVAAWDASTIYNNGDRASVNGKVYEAKWWTQGENPTASNDPWYVWGLVGDCQ